MIERCHGDPTEARADNLIGSEAPNTR